MKFTLTAKNLVANYAGSVWTSVASLVFIPFYVKILGVEAYGLVGFYATMQGVLTLLDMGLSTTVSRETARLSLHGNNNEEIRNLIRTLEWIYWGVGVAVILLITTCSSWIARVWLNPEHLTLEQVELAIILMGIAFAVQWPAVLYQGGLLGFQRQVWMNSVLGINATIKGIATLALLWLIKPTIIVFFASQIMTSFLHVTLMKWGLIRAVPRELAAPRFQYKILKDIRGFSSGVFGISLLGILLMQVDKIILSKLLSLEKYGYYMLATSIAFAFYRLVTPVFNTYYPKFTQLVEKKEFNSLKFVYHQASQMMALIVIPIATVLFFFSEDILWIWTQNQAVVEHASFIVSLLVVGTALNGLMSVPYALQLAHGWTKLSLYVNLVSVCIMIPLIYYLTVLYGGKGAAFGWCLLNSGYIFIAAPLMHRKLLTSEMWRWLLMDVLKPIIIVSLSVASFKFFLMPYTHLIVGTFPRFIMVACGSIGALIVAFLATDRGFKIKLLAMVKNERVQ